MKANRPIHHLILAACFCCFMVAPPSWSGPSPWPVLVKATDSEGKTIVGELWSEDDKVVTLMDLKTDQKVSLQKTTLKQFRKDVSDREAGETIGVPQFLVWKIRKIMPSDFRGKVASVESPFAYLTLGSLNGVTSGQELIVYRGEMELKNPDTGEVLGAKKRKVARLLVTELQEKFCKARLLGELDVELKVGDIVGPTTQEKVIAILPFVDQGGNERVGANKFAEDITTGVVQAGIPVVERTLLDKVLLELGLQKTKLFDIDKAQKIGRQLGAYAVMVGTMSPSGYHSDANIRLIKVETGEILFATGQKGPALGSAPARTIYVIPVAPIVVLPPGIAPNSCCARAFREHRPCVHKCCEKAVSQGRVCTKCNP